MSAWVGETLRYLLGLSWPELAAALAFYAASLLCRAEAWRGIVAAAAPARVRRGGVMAAFLAGGGVNAVVPARPGVALRVLLARPAAPGTSWPTLAGTVVVEAGFNALLALGLVVFGLVHVARSGLPLPVGVERPWLLALAAAVALALALLAGRLARERTRTLAREVARAFAVLGDLSLYLRRVVSWQAADWLARLGTIYWLLRAAGLEPTPATVGLVLVALALATLVPLAPGGAGAKQAALALLLAGAAPSSAIVAFGIALGLAQALVDVVLGLAAFVLVTGSLDLRGAIAAARAALARERADADLPAAEPVPVAAGEPGERPGA